MDAKKDAVRIKETMLIIGALLLVPAGCQTAPPRSNDRGTGFIITTSAGAPAVPPDPEMEYKNFYSICWTGSPADNLRYAKTMHYKYLNYQSGMEKEPDSRDVHFYYESPRYAVIWPLFHDYAIRPGKAYSAEQRANIEKFCAWKSREPFPANIASGWFFNRTDFNPQPDFQQQAVIDHFAGEAVRLLKRLDRPDRNFLFSGVTWDVPNLTGDFWTGLSKAGGGQGRPVTLAVWTGSDSCLLHDSITHEYATYTDGLAAYYRTLRHRLREEFPDRRLRFMMEPYRLYEDWIRPIEGRPDRDALMPDLLFSEGGGLSFVEDDRIFASGLITPDRVGSTTPDEHTVAGVRRIAGRAAAAGAWFNWFGRFGGTGDMIDYKNITEVPAWQKLCRVVPNWDNLARVPLAARFWDGNAYRSPNGAMDEHAIASRNPYTGKLHVVFFDRTGRVTLRPGETVLAVQRIDAFFGPAGDGSDAVAVTGNEIRLR